MKIETTLNCPHCGQVLNLDNIFSQQNTIYILLKKLMNEGGDNNFIVIQIDENYYVQAAGKKGSLNLLCEAVSNKYLAPNKQLNSAQQQRLVELGWEAPNPSHENYSFETTLATDEIIVKTVLLLTTTMKEIYGATTLNNDMFEINLE